MILFAKTLTVLLLIMAVLKILVMAVKDDDRGFTAFDALVYAGLGVWGIVSWAQA
jgi:hypothetical protein